MSEAETRAEHIGPALKRVEWIMLNGIGIFGDHQASCVSGL